MQSKLFHTSLWHPGLDTILKMGLLNVCHDREVFSGGNPKDDHSLKMHSLEGSFQWTWPLAKPQVIHSNYSPQYN